MRDDLLSGRAPLHQRLDATISLTESITDQLRFLAQALHPPALGAVGLDATLEGLCRDFSKRTQLPIEYAGANVPRVSDGVGIHLYRFLQEALTNVSKHAQASGVRVTLGHENDMLSLTVEDDGVGFDVTNKFSGKSQGGIGLIGMRERLDLLKGRLDIMSQPGRGTRLVACVPWKGPS
jgi:signal transduction histidine kinase